MIKEKIIAMGGGGFSTELNNSLLDQYILDASGVDKPRICFLPTAGGDSETYIERFFSKFSLYNCEPFCLSLFRPQVDDIESFLLSMDIIYVGGGSTKNLLAIWKDWGLLSILKQALQKGIILSGVSAGIMCWFEAGLTDSFHGKYVPLKSLGFLAGSVCPHCDSENGRFEAYIEYIQKEEIPSGYAIDDGVALHFENGQLIKAVKSKPNAKVLFISKQSGVIHQRLVETQSLIQ